MTTNRRPTAIRPLTADQRPTDRDRGAASTGAVAAGLVATAIATGAAFGLSNLGPTNAWQDPFDPPRQNPDDWVAEEDVDEPWLDFDAEAWDQLTPIVPVPVQVVLPDGTTTTVGGYPPPWDDGFWIDDVLFPEWIPPGMPAFGPWVIPQSPGQAPAPGSGSSSSGSQPEAPPASGTETPPETPESPEAPEETPEPPESPEETPETPETPEPNEADGHGSEDVVVGGGGYVAIEPITLTPSAPTEPGASTGPAEPESSETEATVIVAEPEPEPEPTEPEPEPEPTETDTTVPVTEPEPTETEPEPEPETEPTETEPEPQPEPEEYEQYEEYEPVPAEDR